MYKLPGIEHRRCIAAIDAKQCQTRPLLAESVYKRAGLHEIMIETKGELSGDIVNYVAVKCLNEWSLYFSCGISSKNGKKATISQVKQLIDIEGDLLELYRN